MFTTTSDGHRLRRRPIPQLNPAAPAEPNEQGHNQQKHALRYILTSKLPSQERSYRRSEFGFWRASARSSGSTPQTPSPWRRWRSGCSASNCPRRRGCTGSSPTRAPHPTPSPVPRRGGGTCAGLRCEGRGQAHRRDHQGTSPGLPGTTSHWNFGCTNVQQLHREVTELGFRGSYATLSHPGPRREYAHESNQ